MQSPGIPSRTLIRGRRPCRPRAPARPTGEGNMPLDVERCQAQR